MTAATRRHYLMCEPTHYTVSYEINPWMDATRFTDSELAVVAGVYSIRSR